MSAKPVFLIVGASLAGAKAAEELRTQGFDGRVLLIGAEPERPYERPPLTKDYLRGESEREKAYVHPDGFYAQREIELETGVTVTGIEPGAFRVTLDDDRRRAAPAACSRGGPRPCLLPAHARRLRPAAGAARRGRARGGGRRRLDRQ
jgi:3-phenylpropionate/trans-cinnamate dioxygenase ferredoxin reductase subunit